MPVRSTRVPIADAAIHVAETLAGTHSRDRPAPFVYLSAADILRPIISPRYTSTKREAEQCIAELANRDAALRPVFMRPGFMYHPHNRPWTTVPATMIDASYHLNRLHRRWRVPVPAPADVVASRLVPSSFHPLAGALTTPPLHVDTVATAVCEAIECDDVHGVQDVPSIRQLAGWPADVEAPADR